MQIYNFAQDAEDLLSKIINRTIIITLKRDGKGSQKRVTALPKSRGQ